MKSKKEPVSLTEKEKLQIGRQIGRRFSRLVWEKFETDRSFLVATGINERQFFRFKEGGNPGLHTIYLFAKALGVHPKELFDFDPAVDVHRWEDRPGVKEYYKNRYGKSKKDKGAEKGL